MSGGTLWLVATPIGNLGDLAPRAVAVLSAAALVCCEDTRRTGRLLQHAGVRAQRLAVANEHTELSRIAEVLDVLAAGDFDPALGDKATLVQRQRQRLARRPANERSSHTRSNQALCLSLYDAQVQTAVLMKGGERRCDQSLCFAAHNVSNSKAAR